MEDTCRATSSFGRLRMPLEVPASSQTHDTHAQATKHHALPEFQVVHFSRASLLFVCSVSFLCVSRYFGGYGSMSQGALQNSVAAGQGVIVNVRNGGHWVLVTGYAGGSTFYVNDSGFASTTYTYGEMVRDMTIAIRLLSPQAVLDCNCTFHSGCRCSHAWSCCLCLCATS